MVIATISTTIMKKQDESIVVDMQGGDSIKPKTASADARNKKASRMKKVKIFTLYRKPRQELRLGPGSGRFLFMITFCISFLITTLILVQHKFINDVQQELKAIHEKTEYHFQTEETPYAFLDAKEPTKKATTEIDATTTTTTQTGAETATDDNQSPVTIDDVKTRDDNVELLNFLKNGLVVHSEEISSSSTVAPLINGRDDDGKKNFQMQGKHYGRHDEVVQYMQLNVVYKIYGYIYAFYISVTFLMILQFIVIFRFVSR